MPKIKSEGTLIGYRGKKEIHTPDDGKHYFIAGTTGAGKTVLLSNYIKSAIEQDYPLLLVDGKGDIGENSILDIVSKMNAQMHGKRKVYTINLSDILHSESYNPFQNTDYTILKDMLINMTNWTEEHYKVNTERYLQRLILMLTKISEELSFEIILKYIDKDRFMELSSYLLKNEKISKQDHLTNIEIITASGKIAESAVARFSTIYESKLGTIFDKSGIDIYTALRENAIILFILNPLIYPELSPLFGNLILIDCKKAVSKLFHDNSKRTFFIFDEVNSYISSTLIDLVNKSRSANVTCILSTQSLSDLSVAENADFTEQVIENCNNYIVLRQNSAVNAEKWANILGTRASLEVSYQLKQKSLVTSETGFGSARRVREYIYHPDDIKTLKAGEGIYLSKDENFHCRIKILKPF